MKNIPLLFLLLLFQVPCLAQVFGTVSNRAGEQLPFASIYLQGTTKGTTTNDEGAYAFELKEGEHTLVFQYIGYQQLVKTIRLGEEPIRLDVVLETEAISLGEVVVNAEAEDPAYAIIRKAIAKRDDYRNRINTYSCDVYIKGNQKVLDAPERFLGREIGNLGGSLDSNRQGILYLSESQAKLFRQQPDHIKEQMISTRVSGNDNGFGFNRAALMDFNFYDNHVEIERKLLSPIANTALQYYRYELKGTFQDEGGRLINKIQVIPKRDAEAVFRGFIYIVEDLWNIHSTELIVTGNSIKEPALDSLIISQIHVPVKAPDVWMLLSQSLDFNFGVFGFKVKGNFTGVFSNYELEPDLPDGFFNNEIFKVEAGANEKDSSYWERVRPIPLTDEEARDYIKKDSLQTIWKSQSYLDSIDQKNNKFKLWDILLGYDWNNSYKKQRFSIATPFKSIQFNPVQGYYGHLDFAYRKRFDDYFMRWYSINPKIQYGFSDKQLRGQIQLTYNFNRTKFTRIRLTAGSMTAQLSDQDPVSPFWDTYSSLFFKNNFIRLYEKDFAHFYFRQEIVNGLFLRGSLEYARRRFLSNQTNHSWFFQSRLYDSNRFRSEGDPVLDFFDHEALIFKLSLRLRIKQKYLSYPQRKYIQGSDWPDFWIHYKKGIKAFGTESDFDQITFNIKDVLTFGIIGFSSFNLELGTFLRQQQLSFVDYQHFNGNRLGFAKVEDYYTSFLLLPYYQYSTSATWFQGHYEHHFEGFLLDKIPLLRRWNLKSVFRASFLYTEDRKDYLELSFGLENLGFGPLRIFRLDLVNAFWRGNHVQTGLVLGIDL